jgi:hypothetical protein
MGISDVGLQLQIELIRTTTARECSTPIAINLQICDYGHRASRCQTFLLVKPQAKKRKSYQPSLPDSQRPQERHFNNRQSSLANHQSGGDVDS